MRKSFQLRQLVGDLIPIALIASILAIAAFAPARAEDKAAGLRPATAQAINVGYVKGVAYYTAEDAGYHVVATLSVAGSAPVRVSATLQPEQVVSFSVPGDTESAPSVVEFARHGDQVVITNPARLVLN